MGVKHRKPPKRVGTYTERVKADAVAVEERLGEAADARLRLVQLVRTLRRLGFSYRRMADVLGTPEIQALAHGVPVVSAQRLQQLNAEYEGGKTSAEQFRAIRRGRPRTRVAPEVVREIRRLALVYGGMAPMTELSAALNQFIADRQLGPAIPYGRFKRLFAVIVPREDRTAAWHGSRAAELFASSHGTVACTRTHQWWTIDAFDAPWYERVLLPELGLWIIVRPAVIIVKDYKSDAVVGYWISAPARRRDRDGNPCTTGFDSLDVLAAIMSAALPMLAPPSTKDLSGYLCEGIRWDRHAVNNALREDMKLIADKLAIHGDAFFEDDQPEYVEHDLANGTTERLLVEIPRLPAKRPKNRGDVERANAFLKKLCWEMPGHVDRYIPAPFVAKAPSSVRTDAAVDGDVDLARTVLAMQDIPTREVTEKEFDQVIAKYNAKRNRVHGQSRITRYGAFLPKAPRRGVDVLTLLETYAAFVSGEGVSVFHDNVQTTFEPYIADLGMRYGLDAKVVGKVDPFYRGFFVRVGGQVYMLPPKDLWAAAPGNAERVAREQRAVARAASTEADALRRREYDMRYGIGAANAAVREAEAYRAARDAADAAGAPAAGQPTAVPDERPIASRRVVAVASAKEAEASRDAQALSPVLWPALGPTTPPPPPVRAVPASPTVAAEPHLGAAEAVASQSATAPAADPSPARSPVPLADAVTRAYAATHAPMSPSPDAIPLLDLTSLTRRR